MLRSLNIILAIRAFDRAAACRFKPFTWPAKRPDVRIAACNMRGWGLRRGMLTVIVIRRLSRKVGRACAFCVRSRWIFRLNHCLTLTDTNWAWRVVRSQFACSAERVTGLTESEIYEANTKIEKNSYILN